MTENYNLTDDNFNVLSKFIYNNYGIHLPISKKILLESRLQKRLRELQKGFNDYINIVLEGGEHEEVIQMINVVSTNKTDFFRENDHFEFLKNTVIKEVSKNKTNLKIWSSACSSGEEVYSIAMTLEEYTELNATHLNYHVVGSDISTNVLQKAYEAVYDEERAKDVPAPLMKKYFLRSKDRNDPKVRVIKKLRDKVRFERFNLVKNIYPKEGTYDIIFCRNVIIYFDKQTQNKIVNNLADCLRPGGYLFLGHSESLIGIDVPLVQVVHTGYKKISQ